MGQSARDHGEQPWIRLVLLVDAHDLLCRLGPTEKIAMTMADLAQGNDERQREGWEVIAEHARTERVKVITAIVDEGPGLLPQDLHEYFERSTSRPSISLSGSAVHSDRLTASASRHGRSRDCGNRRRRRRGTYRACRDARA